MKKTENFELNQWESTDRIMMEDFNNDNKIIDAALGTLKTASESQAATLAQHAAAMAKLGNCSFYGTSYTGTGKSGSGGRCTLTLPQKPVLMLISAWNMTGIINHTGGMRVFGAMNSWHCTASFSNNGKTISWYANSPGDQMNENGVYYTVTAITIPDET